MIIDNFLKSGSIGEISVGLEINKLSFFDRSDSNIEYFNKDDPNEGYIVRLDGIELVILDEKIYSIKIDLHSGIITVLNNCIIDSNTNIEMMLSYLNILGVEWFFNGSETFEKQVSINIACGVKILFKDFGQNRLELNVIAAY